MSPHRYSAIREYQAKVIILLLLAVSFLIRPPVLPAVQNGPAFGVGNHAPPLDFTDMSGGRHVLTWEGDEGDPKGVLLFFFDAYSSPGLEGFSFLKALAPYARDFGLHVYAIESSGLDRGGVQEAVESRIGGYHVPAFPIVADPNYRLSAALDIRALPTTLFIEDHGVILSRMQGFDRNSAVILARRMERGLHRTKGLFSFALREIGIGAEEERVLDRAPARFKADRAFSGPSVLAKGDRVPALILQNLNGRRLRLDKHFHKARATVVIFWEALCQPCIREMNYLETVYRQGEGFGLEIIAVEGSGLSFDRVAQIMERYRRRYSGPSYILVPDPDRRAAGAFGVSGNLPQTFIVDKEGKIVAHYGIFIEGQEKELVAEIEEALGLEPGTILRRITDDLQSGGETPGRIGAAGGLPGGWKYQANLPLAFPPTISMETGLPLIILRLKAPRI